MISAERIREYLQDELTGRGLFLVDVMVRPVNRITVFADSMQGITLEECRAVSRFLEHKLDRNADDFELEVSSPGLDRPLKLAAQYVKNTGRMLDVVKSDGIKITGKLLGINQGIIMIETEATLKDGRTGKKIVRQELHEIKQEEIKSAKVVVSIKK